MTVHDFRESLDWSEQYVDAPWWREVYSQAFPTAVRWHATRQDGWAQRGGVDRIIVLRDGTIIEVDEKVRGKAYDDFFLEFWSDRDRQIPGWVDKDLRIDFIAYAFVPTRRCYLLPYPLLRRAWRQHGDGWKAAYGELPVENKNWVTVGTPVPIDVVLSSISNATVVHWRKEAEAA